MTKISFDFFYSDSKEGVDGHAEPRQWRSDGGNASDAVWHGNHGVYGNWPTSADAYDVCRQIGKGTYEVVKLFHTLLIFSGVRLSPVENVNICLVATALENTRSGVISPMVVADTRNNNKLFFVSHRMVRVRRVELRSPVWKTGIITDIRHPRHGWLYQTIDRAQFSKKIGELLLSIIVHVVNIPIDLLCYKGDTITHSFNLLCGYL